jgi:hypothetical protein
MCSCWSVSAVLMSSSVSAVGMLWTTLIFLLVAGLFSEHVIGSP